MAFEKPISKEPRAVKLTQNEANSNELKQQLDTLHPPSIQRKRPVNPTKRGRKIKAKIAANHRPLIHPSIYSSIYIKNEIFYDYLLSAIAGAAIDDPTTFFHEWRTDNYLKWPRRSARNAQYRTGID